jgi:hypothetical protein
MYLASVARCESARHDYTFGPSNTLDRHALLAAWCGGDRGLDKAAEMFVRLMDSLVQGCLPNEVDRAAFVGIKELSGVGTFVTAGRSVSGRQATKLCSSQPTLVTAPDH